jgi:hypothetical protein
MAYDQSEIDRRAEIELAGEWSGQVKNSMPTWRKSGKALPSVAPSYLSIKTYCPGLEV